MKLSVVVPATDRPSTLERCLAAIGAADPPADEVVVVDDPELRGPAAARNEGVARAAGDLIVFVDADVLVHPDAFGRVREAFGRDQSLVAVFGSYDDTVATSGVVSGFRNLLHHTVHQRYAGRPAHTFWAGLGAVRRRDFDAVDGFDAERYAGPSIEDIELGGRLAERGSIALDGELRGTHLKEWTLSSMVATDLWARGVPWVLLALERRRPPAALNAGARERASTAAAVVGAWGVLTRRPGLTAAAVAAQVALNRDLHQVLARRLGARGVAAGIALHELHQLVAAASLPVALASHLSARRRR